MAQKPGASWVHKLECTSIPINNIMFYAYCDCPIRADTQITPMMVSKCQKVHWSNIVKQGVSRSRVKPQVSSMTSQLQALMDVFFRGGIRRVQALSNAHDVRDQGKRCTNPTFRILS